MFCITKVAHRVLGLSLIGLFLHQPAAAALVHHYKFDETSGFTAADSVGGITASSTSNSGGISSNQTGIIGKAFSFSGTDLAGSGVTNLGSTYSASVWFKAGESTSQENFLWYYNSGSTTQYLQFVIRGDNGSDVAQVFYRNGGVNGSGTTPSAVDDDQWHNMMISQSSTNSRTVYLDGKSIGTNTTNVADFTETHVKFASSRDNTSDYSGLLDDTGFWQSEAHDAADAALLNGLGRTGGIALDQLDEAAALWAGAFSDSATVGGGTWFKISGLTGGLGDWGGSVAGGDAFIVLDGTGNGIAVFFWAPEPSTFVLAVLGLFGLGFTRRRNRIRS